MQGVLFRDFACRNARKLSLVGTVENLPDGKVKAIAEGEEQILEKFLMKLKKGPLFSRVDHVMVQYADRAGGFTNFKIKYNGLLDHL